MSPGPVDFDDLKPDVQEDIRARLAGRAPSPVSREAVVAQQNRRAGAQKRRLTGSNFEAELDVTHAMYEFRKWGKIRRNYVPTRMIGKGKRVAAGPAHVDRTGWVCVVPIPNYAGTEVQWQGCSPRDEHFPERFIVPVAFDAKVMSETQRRGWYFHDKELQHQLHDLKAAADAGEYAFLLVLSRLVGRVFAIPIQPHYAALLSGKGVQLYDHANEDVPLLPSITKRAEEMGWDWISLLPHCQPR